MDWPKVQLLFGGAINYANTIVKTTSLLQGYDSNLWEEERIKIGMKKEWLKNHF